MINLNKVLLILTPTSSTEEEILRNIRVILTTLTGSVPYDREFGISVDVLDMPINEAKDFYIMECVTKVRKYEPRAKVKTISFTNDAKEGILIPKVVLSIESE
ncbi:GPW/gp25 family protein [Psychrobacillus sp. FSL K6-2684]|uniref:GPW/gp25 family protein n=1 Tax=Psychrobacillus sp. FSL K6-2684 TaxID=2921547 RepID=UPI0030F78870